MGAVSVRFRGGRKKPWRAQWYDSVGGGLKPREKWFLTESAALAFKVSHEGEAAQFAELAVSMADRARWWRVREDCAAAGVSVEAAVAAGLAALKKLGGRTVPIAEAREAWELDAQLRKLRPKSIGSVVQMVRAFAERREDAPVNSFTSAEVLRWAAERYVDQISRDGALGRLLTFFRWCAAAPRGWCRPEEFLGVKWAHRVKGERRRIGFYSAAEAGAILAAVEDKLKPAVALAFFAGVRPEELMRMRLAWQAGGEFYGYDPVAGEWHLAAEWTKTRAYRKLYALPECWHHWWLKHAADIVPSARSKKRAGYLVPMNYRNFRHALNRARLRAGVLRAPKDGLRHSFGTHGFHRSADGRARGVEWCIALMGHVGGFRVFEQSYNGKVANTAAEAYFAIYPPAWAYDVKTRERMEVV